MLTYAELMQDYAAKAMRLSNEIKAVAYLKDCPFSAGHDMMIDVEMLKRVSISLGKFAKYSGMEREIDYTKGAYPP